MRFRWRIRHKLAAGLIMVVGITALLATGAVYGLRSYRRSNKVVRHHQRQLELLGYLEVAVSGLNFPSRELFGPDIDLDRANREKMERLERIESMLEKYRQGLRIASESPFTRMSSDKQLAEIDQMAAYLGELKSAVSDIEPVVAAMQPKTFWWERGSERDTIAKLINALDRLRGVIHADVTRHVEADRSSYRASLAVVYSTSVLVLVLLVVLVWLGYQAIFQPILELHRGVTKLAGGDFDSRVRVETGDEMQELGESFNEMADRLQGIYTDLNRQVEERSRQLIRSERLASVGFLAAGVAHEINNPLASIAFCGEALQSRLCDALAKGTEDAEVVENYLEMIQQEAFRCKAITEKLLDFSRVGEAERIDADLAALIGNVTEMVGHLGRAKGKNLVHAPGQPVTARVNPQELKQVLLNLVINALESVEAGGTVTVQAQEDGSSVSITVTDDGCGMTEEVLKNLFEPFFTKSRTGKGTGLGLSISHLIISQHGGTLDAQSPGPGQGSTFTIRLPKQPDPAGEGALPGPAQAA